MSLNQAYLNWQEREVECNNWLIKDSVFIDLPNLKKRTLLKEGSPYLLKYQIPREKCVVIRDEKEMSDIEGTLNLAKDDSYSFFASPMDNHHCENLSLGKPEIIEIQASSSFRSFFHQDLILKISLQDKILYSSQIERAVTISSYLNSVLPSDSPLQILKESYGCYLKDQDNPYGFIIRQIPESVKAGKCSLISIVSYVSSHSDGSPSLFERHLSRLSHHEIYAEVSKLIRSIIRSYLEMYWNFGVCLELHQQNVLLELDENENLTGKIYCRDLDGARLDLDRLPDLREALKYKYQDHFDYIFEENKLHSLKKGINPDYQNSAHWNGLMIFGFRLFLMDSCVFLLDHGLKASGVNLNTHELAIQIVNEEIFRKSQVDFLLQ